MDTPTGAPSDRSENKYDDMVAKAAAQGQIVVFAVMESNAFNEWASPQQRAVFTEEADARRAAAVISTRCYVSPETVEGSFEQWYARNYRAVTTTRHIRRY
jgi:hypothetical protein